MFSINGSKAGSVSVFVAEQDANNTNVNTVKCFINQEMEFVIKYIKEVYDLVADSTNQQLAMMKDRFINDDFVLKVQLP